MARKELEKIVQKVLAELSVDVDTVIVEHPGEAGHGDYATNIALMYAKKLGKDPKRFAEEIKKRIEEFKSPILEKMEIAGPGFINFYLKDDIFIENIGTILEKGDEYGRNDSLEGKKIMVEYTQPNPFKPFHIGHLMSNAIGESISRIIEANGAKVIRANYQGDVGLHVAKALFGIQKLNLDAGDVGQIGKAYVYGSTQYEKNEIAKKEIIDINKKVYKKDASIRNMYKTGRSASLEHFEDIYRILGTKFDYYFFESETADKGKQIVENNIGKVFEKSDGAVIFDGEKYGLHKRVFITGEGIPTYEAKEIGLAFLKRERTDFDLSITATAVEQKEYFKVVFKALSLIDSSFEGRFVHLANGMMQMKGGKMSSRKGNVITGESLLNDIKKRAEERIKGDGENATSLAFDIAVAAIKYSILKYGTGKNIVFDEEQALSFEGDSGPYLQYTRARARSILRKTSAAPSLEDPETPMRLERILQKFPEIIEIAHREYAPSRISSYLIELAQEFNSYYAKNKIMDNSYRLALTKAVATVIHNGLHLLGIESPDKM